MYNMKDMDHQKSKKKIPLWIWIVLGVVLAAAIGVGAYCGVQWHREQVRLEEERRAEEEARQKAEYEAEQQRLSDEAYAAGLVLLETYDYAGAAEQFKAAQGYVAREDAAVLETACESAFDAVYECSFAEGRDDKESLPMTLYLWVHAVIREGEAMAPLGMQSDLSTGSVNSNIFGQSYMNYVYYDQPATYSYTFSYAGSEKDADDETRQIFLMAEFSQDYAEVTTSKIYADTGEVPAAPDIRTWRLVSDTDTADTVRTGIRNKLAMNLVALGELDASAFTSEEHAFTAFETLDDGFALKTAEEIAAETDATAEDADDSNSADAADSADSAEDAGDTESVEEDTTETDSAEADDTDTESASTESTEADSTNTDRTESDGEENLDYATMTEEERKAKAEELEQAEEDERIADQEQAVEDLNSDYVILADADTGEIRASKDSDERMYPASMTKIMTILIAAENVTNLTTRGEVTQEMLDYAEERTLTIVGFRAGEQPTIADLMWGTALCSGADAAQALAVAVAGSEEDFVALMNAKAEALGLAGTHFANCTGTYDDDNYTTPHDMALILRAATQNALARSVLSTRQYTTSFTEQHPAGVTITNSFLRHMDQDQLPGLVLSAKTGYVTQSMYCAASYMIADDGERYICVTGHADSSAACRADHAALYRAFAVPPSHADIEKYLEEILQGESTSATTIEATDAGE